MTEAQAYEAILQHWESEWEALHPADPEDPDHIPWITDNEVASTAAQWARITLVPTVSSQGTIGSAVRWARRGRIAVQLFAAINEGPGALFVLIGEVRTILEGLGIAVGDERVHTNAGSASAPFSEGAWYQSTVNVEYWFHDTH